MIAKVEFIAEIGMNHNGNLALIQEMVRQASLAGATSVKLQLGWRNGPGEINRLQTDNIQQFLNWCSYYEVEPLFSIITPEALTMVAPFNMPRYKIASRTVIEHPEMIKELIRHEKQLIISLGMWSDSELPFKPEKNIDYLWCKSEYPTQFDSMKGFPKSFEQSFYTGYSDHSIGIEACLLAIARGARIIEKHFTLDKSDTSIRDHTLSATPDEFRDLVLYGKAISACSNAIDS